MPPKPPEPSSPRDGAPECTPAAPPPTPLGYQPAWAAALMPKRSPWALFLISNWWVPVAVVGLLAIDHILAQRVLSSRVGFLMGHVAAMVALAVTLQLIVGAAGQVSLGHAAFFALSTSIVRYFSIPPTNVYPWSDDGAAVFVAVATGIVCAVLIGWIKLAVLLRRRSALLTVVMLVPAMLVGLEFVAGPSAFAPDGFVRWIRHAMGRLFHAFVSDPQPMLAFSSAVLTGPSPVAIVSRCVAAAMIGGTLAYIFSIAAHGRSVVLTVLTLALTLAASAHQTWNYPPRGSWTITDDSFLPLLILAALGVLICWRITRSDLGRAMAASREDERAAEVVGISPARQQARAFVIACALAGGVAGMQGMQRWPAGTPEGGLLQSIELLALVIIAGRRSISGVVLVTIVLVTAWAFMPAEVLWWRFAVYAIGLIGFIRFRPQGIFGEWELFRSRSVLPAQAGAASVPGRGEAAPLASPLPPRGEREPQRHPPGDAPRSGEKA